MNTIPITKRGAELLKEELHRLKHIERPSVINAISEARAQGDLSENAEYDAAKEKQGFIEGRIQELEGKLSAAQIIDPASLDVTGRVVFGALDGLGALRGTGTIARLAQGLNDRLALLILSRQGRKLIIGRSDDFSVLRAVTALNLDQRIPEPVLRAHRGIDDRCVTDEARTVFSDSDFLGHGQSSNLAPCAVSMSR